MYDLSDQDIDVIHEVNKTLVVINDDYKNKNFYIIDDIYATGNTARAIKEAVEALGGNIQGTGVVINIKELNNDDVFSLIDINEE